jgi:AraC family transcriptional regulator, arabinose operon regulatory protein
MQHNVYPGPQEGDFISGRTVMRDCAIRWLGNRCYDWSLVYTIEGDGVIGVTRGEELMVGAGSVALIAPGFPHYFSSSPKNWVIIWFHFVMRPHMDIVATWEEVFQGMRHVLLPARKRQNIEHTLDEILQLDMHRNGSWRELAYNLIENTILRCGHLAAKNQESSDNRLRHALAWIHTHPNETLSVVELAKACGLSRSNFYALFRKQVGCSPLSYQETLRIEQAKRLLGHSDLLIKEIAATTGFLNQYYFSSRFSKRVGHSPSSYRKLTAGGPKGQVPNSE